MQPKRVLPGFFSVPTTTTATIVACGIVTAAALLGLCGGCSGGGSNTPATYSVFPQSLPGGNLVDAEGTINFSGSITNSTSRAPRFIVEKSGDEPWTYDAAHDPATNPDYSLTDFNAAPNITKDNHPHGMIDSVSGVYLAPKWLPDQINGTQTEDTIDLVSSDTYDRLAAIVKDIREKLDTKRTAYDGNPSDATIADAIAAERLAPDPNGKYYGQRKKDNISNADKALSKQYAADALGRLAADLSSMDKQSTTFTVQHKVTADAEANVSIRTQMRLASSVRVLGDPKSSDLTNGNVTYTLLDPSLGAGGTVDANTGMYAAPAVVPDQARTNQNSRRGYDLVQITSKADPKKSTTIKVNLTYGAAGNVAFQ